LKVLAQLNDEWRVVYDPMQWLLQRREGSKWNNRSYCVTKDALLRCIREYCPKGVDITGVESFPEWHPDRQICLPSPETVFYVA
jgi:hypothetical protein